jgi:hypothetical protein
MSRHPTAFAWLFPPERAALPARTNLRELAARPDRLEHHLVVVARASGAQLELAVASEPLYFAHANISDEYALALPTGDALADSLPLSTFLLDPATAALAGRIRHRVGDLVLHPHGLLHWPGMLRPPYAPPAFPGPRRAGLSLVFCAAEPTPPAARPLFVSPGREADVKAHAGAPPFLLAELARSTGEVARVGEAHLALHERPAALDGPAYWVVLEADAGSPFFACDLVHVAAGERVEADGVARALCLRAPEVEPPPPSWSELPPPPFAPFEDGSPAEPPAIGALSFALGEDTVRVTLGQVCREVPRYWLARMLFRIALHGYRIGYLETYEGFFYDDRDGHRLGLRGGGHVAVDDIASVVERLYRAVAPRGYRERLQ